MDSIMDYLIRIFTIVGTLGIIIIIHELGHFLSAKWFDTRREEFGLGLPPRICGLKKVPSSDKSMAGKKGKTKFFWRGKVPNPKDIDTTVYSLNIIPLGGFVKITGEDGEGKMSKKEKDPKNFNNKKAWQRTIILLAGVTMNLILGVFLFMVIFWMGSPPLVEPEEANYDHEITDTAVTIVGVAEDGPGKEAGLEIGDAVVSVDDEEITSDNDFVAIVNQNAETELELELERGGDIINTTATPEEVDDFFRYVGEDEVDNEDGLEKHDIILYYLDNGKKKSFELEEELLDYFTEAEAETVELGIQRGNEVFDVETSGDTIQSEEDLGSVGILGIGVVDIDTYEYPWWKVPYYAFVEMGRFLVFLPQELYRVFSDYFAGETGVPVTGPVGIAVMTSKAVSFGLVTVLALMINITVALAVFNVLPFPALDGGRVIFILIEKLRGKPINPKFEQRANAVGLIILLCMGIWVTFHDVTRWIF